MTSGDSLRNPPGAEWQKTLEQVSKPREAAGSEMLHPRRPARWGRIASWCFGLLLLGALVGAALHLGDIEQFVALARAARPAWLLLAVAAQVFTYFCSTGVWYRVLDAAQSPRFFATLLPLGVAKVFTDQAIPTGGLSGTLLVYRGLLRRRVRPDVAMAALMVGMVSYYSSYLVVVLASFGLLWLRGMVGVSLAAAASAFAVVAFAIPLTILAVQRRTRRHGLPRWLDRFSHLHSLMEKLREMRVDLLKSPRLLAETVLLQLSVFALDAGTLWFVFRAIGINPNAAVPFISLVVASVAATLGPVPLGLGTFEAACAGMLHLLGIAIEPALTATLLLRGFTFWLPMIPGAWFARRELGRSRLVRPFPPGTAVATPSSRSTSSSNGMKGSGDHG
jgi:uncharacterized protein (TIRG00374 family)